ncbi:MAG: heavy-metal-associated domain-containing protein [Acidobacteria bacterium]|nr:heavy-metal-associated domain-containing protein [Acidobacteriota bacterium]
MTKSLSLAIEGMHCGGCVNRVTNALNKLEGVTVRSVQVGSASVEFDSGKLSEQSILDAVNKLGFTASAS